MVKQVDRGFIVLVDRPATWTSPRESLTAEMKSPPAPWSLSLRVLAGRNDPDNPARFQVPIHRPGVEKDEPGELVGHIVGHLLPDDTVRLDWKPLAAVPATQSVP